MVGIYFLLKLKLSCFGFSLFSIRPDQFFVAKCFDRFESHVSVACSFATMQGGIFSKLCLLKENKSFGKRRKEKLAFERTSIKIMRLERMLQEKLECGREWGFPSYKETVTVYLMVKVFLISNKQVSIRALVGKSG